MKKFNRMREAEGMHTYTFLICNGNAAASRGMDVDGYFEREVKAPNLKRSLQKIWKDVTLYANFDDFCNWYGENGDNPRDWTAAELFDYLDSQDFSGGESWIEAYMVDGEIERKPEHIQDLVDRYGASELDKVIYFDKDKVNLSGWGVDLSDPYLDEYDDEFEESKKNTKPQSARVREGLLDKAVAKMKNLGYEALGGDEALAREIQKYKAHPEKYAHSPLKDLVDKLLIKKGFMDENGMFYDDDYDYLEDDDFTDYDETGGEIEESLKDRRSLKEASEKKKSFRDLYRDKDSPYYHMDDDAIEILSEVEKETGMGPDYIMEILSGIIKGKATYEDIPSVNGVNVAFDLFLIGAISKDQFIKLVKSYDPK